jgi:hypothetical protein
VASSAGRPAAVEMKHQTRKEVAGRRLENDNGV